MPKFVIERPYLVPMYQHIVVEAENLEEACEKGISDDIDWNTQEMDCDSARVTVNFAGISSRGPASFLGSLLAMIRLWA